VRRVSKWLAVALVLLAVVAIGGFIGAAVWPRETADIRGIFYQCSSSSGCAKPTLTTRALQVRFQQPGLLGRTIVAAVRDGSFETRLPLGTYELSVDGCKMPKGHPYTFVQTIEGSRYLEWTIDSQGVCVLGAEAPAGIFCCTSANEPLRGSPMLTERNRLAQSSRPLEEGS
jgi:hypothetical protein